MVGATESVPSMPRRKSPRRKKKGAGRDSDRAKVGGTWSEITRRTIGLGDLYRWI